MAGLAFCGHVFAIKLVARRRCTPWMVRLNVVAVALTLAAMAIAGVLAEPGRVGWSVLVAWLVGHFGWSVVLSSWILAGGAVEGE